MKVKGSEYICVGNSARLRWRRTCESSRGLSEEWKCCWAQVIPWKRQMSSCVTIYLSPYPLWDHSTSPLVPPHPHLLLVTLTLCHLTTSPPHHHITTSPHHHITTSPHHHITTSPCPLLILSPSHLISISSHLCFLPWHFLSWTLCLSFFDPCSLLTLILILGYHLCSSFHPHLHFPDWYFLVSSFALVPHVPLSWTTCSLIFFSHCGHPSLGSLILSYLHFHSYTNTAWSVLISPSTYILTLVK